MTGTPPPSPSSLPLLSARAPLSSPKPVVPHAAAPPAATQHTEPSTTPDLVVDAQGQLVHVQPRKRDGQSPRKIIHTTRQHSKKKPRFH